MVGKVHSTGDVKLHSRRCKPTARTRKPVDVELAELMERMRYEVARELGLEGVREGYLGEATCVQCGHYGHLLYQRAKRLLQDSPVPDSEKNPSPSAPNAEKLARKPQVDAEKSAKRQETSSPVAEKSAHASSGLRMDAGNSAENGQFLQVPKNRRKRGSNVSSGKAAGRTRAEPKS